MGARTAAREAALQMLFSADLGSTAAEATVANFWREFPGDPEGRVYADAAVHGVLEQKDKIDVHVRKASQNWRLERMTAIDRNVLRLGTWELLNRPDVPRAVIIDESVEIAKRYGGKENASFVNGVLDRIANDCGRIDEPRTQPRGASERAASNAAAAAEPSTELRAPPPGAEPVDDGSDDDDDDE
jgi:N utilization substance protein B